MQPTFHSSRIPAGRPWFIVFIVGICRVAAQLPADLGVAVDARLGGAGAGFLEHSRTAATSAWAPSCSVWRWTSPTRACSASMRWPAVLRWRTLAPALSRRILWFRSASRRCTCCPAAAGAVRPVRGRAVPGIVPARLLFCRPFIGIAAVLVAADFVLLLPQYRRSNTTSQPIDLENMCLTGTRLTYAQQHSGRAIEPWRFRFGRSPACGAAGLRLLIGRFVFSLQVFQHDYFTTRAKTTASRWSRSSQPRRHRRPERPFWRAIIQRFTLEITPSKVEDLDATIEARQDLIEIQPKDRRRFRKPAGGKRSFEASHPHACSPRKSRALPPTVTVSRRRGQRPACSASTRSVRWPHAPRLHQPHQQRPTWTASRKAGSRAPTTKGTEHIGKTGLEKSTNSICTAKPATRRSRSTPADGRAQPVAHAAGVGNNLTLTLDIKLQEMAERRSATARGAGGHRAVDRRHPGAGVDRRSTRTCSSTGSASDWDLLQQLARQTDGQPRRNGAYPPGSTFKPFATGGAGTGQRTPGQAIADPGFFSFGGHHLPRRQERAGTAWSTCTSHRRSPRHLLLHAGHDMGIDNIARFMARSVSAAKPASISMAESVACCLRRNGKSGVSESPEQRNGSPGDHLDWHRPGLQRLHADPAGAGRGGAGQRRYCSNRIWSNYITDSRTGDKTMIEPNPVFCRGSGNIETIKEPWSASNREAHRGARAFAGAEYVSGGKTGTAQVFSLKGRRQRPASSRKNCATMPCSSPSRRPRNRRSRWPCWSRTGRLEAHHFQPDCARMVMDYYLLGKSPNGAAEDEQAGWKAERGQELDLTPAARASSRNIDGP